MLQLERTIENDTRHYTGHLNGVHHYGISATSLVSKFDPKPWYLPWLRKLGGEVIPEWVSFNLSGDELEEEILRLGRIEAEKVSDKAAKLGTSWHEQVEHYLNHQNCTNTNWEELFEEKPELFKFLQQVDIYQHSEFFGSEIPLIYKDECGYCVGGTADVLFTVNLGDFAIYKESETKLPQQFLAIGDWKFPSNPKYAGSCLHYFVQLAIYRASLKYTYDIEVNDALLVQSPNYNKDGTPYKKLFLFWLDKEMLDYYEWIFKKMLWLYNHDLVFEFNWAEFVEETKAKNLQGKRLVFK